MAENSSIEWTDHTFNPWEGCTKVSPGCAHCYAEARNRRFAGGANWGPGSPRRRTSAANWKQVERWNRAAGELGLRPRVFCASLADWLDDEVPVEWLADLLDLIRRTPHLDWLLLTKRPQNWQRRIGQVAGLQRHDYADALAIAWLHAHAPSNVWIGTTVEDQPRAEERIPALLKIPARVRFLSCEPLLGAVNLDFGHPRFRTAESYHAYIHWVICGGESGPAARPMHPDWARSLRDQCAAAGVAFFFKQWGEWVPGENVERCGRLRCAWYVGTGEWVFGTQTDKQSENCHADDSPDVYRVGKKAAGHLLDGREHNEFPA